MPTSKIRAAILGYGRSGSTMHAGGIEQNDSFEVAAVCDVDAERRGQAAERFGCEVYDDHHQMLQAEQLDLVCVITRTDQHCQMTCDCLEAGVNVLVTKPWAANAAEAERMVAAATSSGKLLLPWLPARWGSVLLRLKELLAAGTIGKVFLVRRAVCSFGTRSDWQIQRRCGGGYLLNWGPHIVDPPVVLIGSPVQSVYARMRQTINTTGDTEDVFLAMMTLADGVIVQAEYTVAVEDLPTWYVQGDRGTIVARGSDLTIHTSVPAKPGDPTQYTTMKTADDQVTEETVPGSEYGDTDQVYREIAQAVGGQRKFAVEPADALQLSRVLDAIRTAADENRVMDL